MTDPKFCFRSDVQYPNRLRFHDAPELLRITRDRHYTILKREFGPQREGEGGKMGMPTLAVILDSPSPRFRPKVSQSGLAPPQNCT